MTYNYNIDLSTESYEIKIDTEDNYGFFEHHKKGDESAGGLWFEGHELIDYDGVFTLPTEVKYALKEHGYFGEALS